MIVKPGAGLSQVDLDTVRGGLRYYIAAQGEGYIELLHRRSGTVLRVSEDTFRHLVNRTLKNSTKPFHEVVLACLKSLLPVLCDGCGEILALSEYGACASCRKLNIADLMRIAAGG